MIYKDKKATKDHENYPIPRDNGIPESCLNCGKFYGAHLGWRCPDSNSPETTFSRLPAEERYLTQSMKDSVIQNGMGFIPANERVSAERIKEHLDSMVSIKKTSVKSTTDISDWRAWAHNRPGECACGIKREQCTYHKP